MNNENKNRNQNIWTVLLALGLSILTFVYVTYENSTYIQSTNPNGSASIQGNEVLTNVPIEINIDREQYFVSGVPETATVHLFGPQSILTQTLGTQSIVAQTPDLNSLGPGTHTIDLRVDDLPDQLSYDVEPRSITITIEERVAQSFPVDVNLDESYVAEGYTIGEPTLSQESVEVTGLDSAVNSIARVGVVVPPGEEPYTSDITQTLPIVLYDENNELVDASASPSEISVTIPVEGSQTTVPIQLEITGDNSQEYMYEVGFASEEESEVTLVGPESIINEIDELVVEVDVSDISDNETLTLSLPIPEGVANASREEVNVEVSVTQVNDSNQPISVEESSSESSDEETQSTDTSESESEESASESTNDSQE